MLYESDGNVQEQVQVRFREVEIAEFRVEDPVAEADALRPLGKFRALVGDVGIDVAVQEDDLAGVEGLAHERGRPVAVLREEQGHELRMYGVDAAELALEETADEVAVHRGVVAREMDVLQFPAALGEVFLQFLDLGGLPRPVQALQHDEHGDSVYCTNIVIFAL